MADSSLYRVLGLSRNATNSDIKKAYKRLAMEYHPDRNADQNAETKFKEVGFAYSVLSDPHKRAKYDQFGLDAVREGGEDGPMDGSFFNMFRSGGGFFGMPDMFGGGGMCSRKNDDSAQSLEVTLEDLYKGNSFKVPITREVLCNKCNGLGAKAVQKCMPCNGRGITVNLVQMGRGRTQQLHSHCVKCQGTGEIMLEKDRCNRCKGKKTLKTSRLMDVNIDPGMKHREKLRYQGMGDESVGMEPGDLYIVLQQVEHPRFKRDGANLHIKLDVSIAEALCGYVAVINHLDGRCLTVRTRPGEVLKPGDIKSIADEGMPMHRQYRKGSLVVHFNIKFPENHFAGIEELKELEKLLPARSVVNFPPEDELEPVELMDYKLEDQESGRRPRGEAYDEDDERGGGQSIGCSQQ